MHYLYLNLDTNFQVSEQCLSLLYFGLQLSNPDKSVSNNLLTLLLEV